MIHADTRHMTRHAPLPTWLASELVLLWDVDMAAVVRGCWRAENDDDGEG